MAKHSLQRFSSPSRSHSALVHLGGIVAFTVLFRWVHNDDNPKALQFGSHYQYLTMIGLALAYLSMIFGFLADVSLVPAFFDVKNIISVCSAPLEVIITLLFWGIYMIDPALLFPPDRQLPFLINFGLHALPAIMLTLDLLIFSPPWTIKAYGALGLSLVLAFAYWGWVEVCFRYNDEYPYPLFGLLNTQQRVLLFTFSAVLMTGSTMALKWLYGKVNGIEKFEKEAARPAKLD
ncbi:Integral membrane protein [Pleurostoma richardsiae]|uniref:Integral membrane protein n=1 Tax=Pleurostoma richardsiae TaxID=41990 RepID=A0AA38VQE3_9PEZI|nr:Integral membrane protein [Pleurostoma richardsiae]